MSDWDDIKADVTSQLFTDGPSESVTYKPAGTGSRPIEAQVDVMVAERFGGTPIEREIGRIVSHNEIELVEYLQNYIKIRKNEKVKPQRNVHLHIPYTEIDSAEATDADNIALYHLGERTLAIEDTLDECLAVASECLGETISEGDVDDHTDHRYLNTGDLVAAIVLP